MSDPSGLVRAVDAIQRVLAACVEVERTRTHWIACTAFDIVRKRAESPLLTLGRRPSWPFFLAADRGHAGPSLSILAHDRAVADRLTFGEYVVNVALGGIDQDSAWRFLPVVSDDLTPIGGRNPRLPVGRVRQFPPVARREIGIRHGTRRGCQAAEQRLEKALGRGRSHRGEKRRDRDAGHEDVFDAAAQAGLATDQQSERPPTRAQRVPRRTSLNALGGGRKCDLSVPGVRSLDYRCRRNLAGNRLELLRDVVPQLRRLGIIERLLSGRSVWLRRPRSQVTRTGHWRDQPTVQRALAAPRDSLQSP